jgi:hypothetical protein
MSSDGVFSNFLLDLARENFSPFPFALLAMTQKEGLSVPVASVLFTTLLTLPCRVVFY